MKTGIGGCNDGKQKPNIYAMQCFSIIKRQNAGAEHQRIDPDKIARPYTFCFKRHKFLVPFNRTAGEKKFFRNMQKIAMVSSSANVEKVSIV